MPAFSTFNVSRSCLFASLCFLVPIFAFAQNQNPDRELQRQIPRELNYVCPNPVAHSLVRGTTQIGAQIDFAQGEVSPLAKNLGDYLMVSNREYIAAVINSRRIVGKYDREGNVLLSFREATLPRLTVPSLTLNLEYGYIARLIFLNRNQRDSLNAVAATPDTDVQLRGPVYIKSGQICEIDNSLGIQKQILLLEVEIEVEQVQAAEQQ